MKLSLWMLFPAIALLSCCSPPPVARGIYCNNWRSCSRASQEFTAVLLRRFPIGSSQGAIENELLKQGFHHLPQSITECLSPGDAANIGSEAITCPSWDANWSPRHYLSYDFGWTVLCGRSVSILWSADKDEKITHIEGSYDVSCL